MNKFYLLDTNVLLHNANAIYGFPNADVAFPVEVLEQVDKFKRDLGDLGKNARLISQILSDLHSNQPLAKDKGIALKNGSHLQILMSSKDTSRKTVEDICLDPCSEAKRCNKRSHRRFQKIKCSLTS